jgi:DNA-binding LytR/AlgR family response regulator
LEKTLAESIGKFASLEIIDILFDRVTATERLNQLHPDILFVDVDDPAIGTLDLSEVGNQPGASFAITNNNSSEYIRTLLDRGFFDIFFFQHFTFELFCRKVNKLLKCLHYLPNKGGKQQVRDRALAYALPEESVGKEGMFVRYNKTSVKIKFSDIIHIKNTNNILKIYLVNNKVVYHNSTLRKFVKSLPADQFIRINNSTIINHTKVEEFSRNSIFIGPHAFPVTKSYMEGLKKVLRL